MKMNENGHKIEGTDDDFEATGSVPQPLVLFIALWTKSMRLFEKYEARRKRVYNRCGKVVLKLGINPKLCKSCAIETSCLCCSSTTSSLDFDANCCKNCAPKARGLCGKCNDPLKGSKVQAKLCKSCGLGGRGKSCAKMIYGSNI